MNGDANEKKKVRLDTCRPSSADVRYFTGLLLSWGPSLSPVISFRPILPELGQFSAVTYLHDLGVLENLKPPGYRVTSHFE